MARTLAIGDVHGCRWELERLVEVVTPRTGDALVLLGDYVDRGPDTAGVLEWIAAYSGPAELIVLRGNHDQLMMNARRDLMSDDETDAVSEWIAMGGREALASYTGVPPGELGPLFPHQFAAVPERHWGILEDSRPYFETTDTIFVHAVPDASLPMDVQTDFDLYWRKLHEFPPRHCSGKRVVCGHTSQKSGRPKWNDDYVCIDTDCARGGKLTCLEVGPDRVWQVRRDGEVLQCALSDF